MLMLTSNPITNQTSELNSLEKVPLVVDIRNYTNWRQLANCKGEEKSCDMDISVLQVIFRVGQKNKSCSKFFSKYLM